MTRSPALILGLLLSSFLVVPACGDDDDGDDDGSGGTGGIPEQTGQQCKTAADCYPDIVVDGGDGGLLGEAQCLDKVQGGYCTHLCTADTDCCAVEGECKTDLKQVCSPFENTNLKMCFLSCEDADLKDPDGGPVPDAESFCQKNVSPDFQCRSSGGGNENRKICVPVDCRTGEDCAADTDCDTGLTCITRFAGGYCAKTGCTVNADCPGTLPESVCVKDPDGNYCARRCTAETDCSQCRASDVAATCKTDATFAEAGTTGSVCIPTLK